MSSYQPLADHLARRKGDVWNATFEDVERALGRPLPPSAYRYNAWWANQSGPGHSQTHGWRSVGWRTSKLDLERRRVRFERDRAAAQSQAREELADSRSPAALDALFAEAMAVSGLEDRAAVIESALRDFIAHQAARGLIEMGGTMPGYEAAPRERPWS
jgi:hypothetical protein